MALGIGLEEDYTFTVSYKRDFSTATGMPEPGTGAAKTLNDLLHFEIAANTIDIMTIRLGYSLGRHFGAHASFGESVLATVDLFVSMPPTGGEKSLIKLRSHNGEIVKFIKEKKLKKVQAAIQADQVRVSSPSKDELQDAMRALREHDFGVALQFGNYR
jgi:hypothetical protein